MTAAISPAKVAAFSRTTSEAAPATATAPAYAGCPYAETTKTTAAQTAKEAIAGGFGEAPATSGAGLSARAASSETPAASKADGVPEAHAETRGRTQPAGAAATASTRRATTRKQTGEATSAQAIAGVAEKAVSSQTASRVPAVGGRGSASQRRESHEKAEVSNASTAAQTEDAGAKTTTSTTTASPPASKRGCESGSAPDAGRSPAGSKGGAGPHAGRTTCATGKGPAITAAATGRKKVRQTAAKLHQGRAATTGVTRPEVLTSRQSGAPTGAATMSKTSVAKKSAANATEQA